VIPYFHNLVENGDGEGSAGSPTGARVFSADWFTIPQFTVVSYGAVGGFPGVLSPTVPINHGANFFAGGKAALSFTYRYIELPPISSSIDAGAVKYVLSADLGGFQSQDDNARVIAGFYDVNVVTLGITTTIGPVLAADRADVTGFRHVASAPAVVPAHAHWVYLEIDLTRVSAVGPYNDGYADNVSLILLPRAALFLPLVRR